MTSHSTTINVSGTYYVVCVHHNNKKLATPKQNAHIMHFYDSLVSGSRNAELPDAGGVLVRIVRTAWYRIIATFRETPQNYREACR